MTEDQYIEFSFVQRALKKYGMNLRDILIQDIDNKDLISEKGSGGKHLLESIQFTVKRAGEKGGELLLIFPTYGRFIEIHYFKRRQNSSLMGMPNKNQTLWGKQRNRKTKGKKDTRWYTRNVMGLLNELEGELMYGFTDAVRQELISKLIGPYK